MSMADQSRKKIPPGCFMHTHRNPGWCSACDAEASVPPWWFRPWNFDIIFGIFIGIASTVLLLAVIGGW